MGINEIASDANLSGQLTAIVSNAVGNISSNIALTTSIITELFETGTISSYINTVLRGDSIILGIGDINNTVGLMFDILMGLDGISTDEVIGYATYSGNQSIDGIINVGSAGIYTATAVTNLINIGDISTVATSAGAINIEVSSNGIADMFSSCQLLGNTLLSCANIGELSNTAVLLLDSTVAICDIVDIQSISNLMGSLYSNIDCVGDVYVIGSVGGIACVVIGTGELASYSNIISQGIGYLPGVADITVYATKPFIGGVVFRFDVSIRRVGVFTVIENFVTN
jgi:hypothetical protein